MASYFSAKKKISSIPPIQPLLDLALVVLVNEISGDSIFSVHRCVQKQLQHQMKNIRADQRKAKAAAKFYTTQMTNKRKGILFVGLGLKFIQAARKQTNLSEASENFKKAAVWFEKAAQLENADSFCWLYLLHHLGLGFSCDEMIAEGWAKKSDKEVIWILSQMRIERDFLVVFCETEECVKNWFKKELWCQKGGYLDPLKLAFGYSLKTLSLSANDIGDSGVNAIAESLRVNTSLQTLYLANNNIRDSGASEIAKSLRVNASLQILNFASNYIRDSGASVIAESLRENTSLQTLNLASNYIGDSGASAIAESLRVNTSLQTLNLASNYIRDSGARAIAESLRVNTSLQTLNLTGNNIGDLGASAIAESLGVNTSLQTLNLSANDIGDSGANEIAKSLRIYAFLHKPGSDEAHTYKEAV
ncbi:hypothetical protein HK096_002567 [Nowakowskiella sp. JEL0078]|nr:hypothetical protein HK096_002567 [Nowakowskiella sp. JEL0078]